MSDLNAELERTATMLVRIAKTQGIYYAVALLHDSNYDANRIKALLPILEKTKGSIINEIQPDEDGQCPYFIHDCFCGLCDGIIPESK